MRQTIIQKTRDAADILKDFFRIRMEINALQDELLRRFSPDMEDSISDCTALYAVDRDIKEAIGEFLHAEFRAGRITFSLDN